MFFAYSSMHEWSTHTPQAYRQPLSYHRHTPVCKKQDLTPYCSNCLMMRSTLLRMGEGSLVTLLIMIPPSRALTEKSA